MRKEITKKTPMLFGLLMAFSPLIGTTAIGATTNSDFIAKINELRQQSSTKSKALKINILKPLSAKFPYRIDWIMQDSSKNIRGLLSSDKILQQQAEIMLLNNTLKSLNDKKYIKKIKQTKNSQERFELYFELCAERRRQRLQNLYKKSPEILYIMRRPVQPSFYAYTEGQSDAQSERHFMPNSSLQKVSFSNENIYGTTSTLLKDPKGAIRDIDVSYDANKIMFAWKKSDYQDDFSIYEMNFANNNKITQLTGQGTLGVADYEARYLPNEKIIFNSTRCVQTVDCWKVEVSNLYTADSNGKNIIRLGYDQVHTNYPTVTNEGTIIYTRWDYNDRGQLFPQPLFQMNPDGTNQTEFYGNNSYFPTVIAHARMLPNSHKVLAVLHGHHTWQAGKIALINRERGTQEAAGVEFVAPMRKATAVKVDKYGQDADLFRHPFPITNTEFIVAYSPLSARDVGGRGRIRFGLYYFDFKGNRELLVPPNKDLSVNTPIPLAKRQRPPIKPSRVDYSKPMGTYYLHDIYYGPGLKGVKRGTIKKLRVVKIEYRAAYVGHNSNQGEAGSALVSTPVATGNGTWDPKEILGETPVYADGSAMFKVPANTPVYFQCIDVNGNVAATMRSWSTLMPNEYFSCIGCHEDKNQAPPVKGVSLAMQSGAKNLQSFYNVKGGFSYLKYVQPILDINCISCHNGENKNDEGKLLLDLRGTIVTDDKSAKRKWSRSYLNLTSSYLRYNKYFSTGNNKLVNWITSQSRPSMLPPYYKGAAESKLIKMLRNKHNDITLSKKDLNIISAWIDLGVPFSGDYVEANDWSKSELDLYIKFQRKRERYANENRISMENVYDRDNVGKKLKLPPIKPCYTEYLKN